MSAPNRWGLGDTPEFIANSADREPITDILPHPKHPEKTLMAVELPGFCTFIREVGPSVMIGLILFSDSDVGASHFLGPDDARRIAQSLNKLADSVTADAAKQASAAFARAARK